jgi:homoserine dehydrogenase
MKPIIYRIVLAGLGNVGSNLLTILYREKKSLQKRYGVNFCVVGVSELGGSAMDTNGLDLQLLLETLQSGKAVSELPQIGRPDMEAIDLIKQAQPDILLEATPVNLEHGQPGLDNVKIALKNGVHAVLANKGPIALAYNEFYLMSDLGAGWGINYDINFTSIYNLSFLPKLRFSACVAGSLPSINMGWRDLAGYHIQKMEAVFNGTTQYILRAMEKGRNYENALLDTQHRGIAEADPTLDVDGLDSAAKLVIVANAVLGQKTTLADIYIEGIRSLDNTVVKQALANKQRIVLICLAEYIDNQYQLSVKPTWLPINHPLSQITPDEMAIAYYTQDLERLFTASSEPGPEPAAAAMLRDMLDIIRSDMENIR